MKIKLTPCPDHKIASIVVYRFITDKGLKDSKDAVEEAEAVGLSSIILHTPRSLEQINDFISMKGYQGYGIVVEEYSVISGSFDKVGLDSYQLNITSGNDSLSMKVNKSSLYTMIDAFLENSQGKSL